VKWYWGLAWLAGGASVGALAGAAFTPGGGDRKHAAAMGAAGGVTLVGIAALGATISPDTRAAGLTAVLPVAGLVVLGAVSGAHQQLT
jgi:hypothetical protein